MSAYIIAIKLNTRNEDELVRYRQLVGGVVVPDLKALVVYGEQEILEGPPHEGMVILEFPDKQAALGWYNSDAYQEARKHRLKGGDYQFTPVEGFSPGGQAVNS
jgi:uncharacterized protein (DUF1330 family)